MSAVTNLIYVTQQGIADRTASQHFSGPRDVIRHVTVSHVTAIDTP